MSVITTLRAPAMLAIGTAMQPIGPAPVMSTSSPTRSNESAVWTALPSGSEQEITSSGILGSHRQRFELGTETIFGEATRPIHADALCVRAKVTPAGEAIAAMTANDVAFGRDEFAFVEIADTTLPTRSITPTNSCPMTIGTGIVFCAQASQL